MMHATMHSEFCNLSIPHILHSSTIIIIIVSQNAFNQWLIQLHGRVHLIIYVYTTIDALNFIIIIIIIINFFIALLIIVFLVNAINTAVSCILD